MNGVTFLRRASLFFILPFALGGCWHYSTSGSQLPSVIKTVAVPLFENVTTWEYGIKEKLTDAVIDAFVADNTLRIAGERNADSVVRARIISIGEIPFTYDKAEQVQQYKMEIILSIQFEDLKNRKIIWEDTAMEGWGVYATDGEEWQDGIDRAIEKLAVDIVNRTVAEW